MARLLLLILIVFVMFLSCAHQVGPSGGPKDEVPPTIIRSVPEPGTLNHPGKRKIILYFSEWVDMRSVKKSATVFPTLTEGFKVTVGGRRVEISPETFFAESTTYHIGINTELTDLHGVSVGTPYNFFFSTGPTLDSGVVTGCVIDTEKKGGQPKVALYRCEEDSVHDTAFLQLPSYLIQTDSVGLFEFEHIRRGTYILLAFNDDDNDNRISPGKERAFASREKMIVLEREAGPFVLFPTATDTLSPTVSKIKAISATTISGEWAEGTQGGRLDNAWTIISLDSTTAAPKVKDYIPVIDSRFFILRLSDSLSTGSYSLIYTINPRISIPPRISDTSKSSDTALVLRDTIRFNGTIYPDTAAPYLQSSWPKDTTGLDTYMKLMWTSPVRALTGEWVVADTSGDTVRVTIDTLFSETTVFKPQRKLLPERYYTLSIPAEWFEDFTGNTPRQRIDTTKSDTAAAKDKTTEDTAVVFSASFSTLAAKDLCYSLSGSALCLEPDSQRIWLFKPFESAAEYETADRGSTFRFDSIPGGKGTFGYFVDYNNDKNYSPGSLFPWIPPEPRFSFADTVEARARWDIEGLEVPACDACPKKEELPVPEEETVQDTVQDE